MEQAARWRVPSVMVNTLPSSVASDMKKAGTSSSPALSIPPRGVRKNSTSSVVSRGSKSGEASGVVKDVALKIIPKKKVKGNEAAVWGEMEVLKGLDHGNIVRAAQPLLKEYPLTHSPGQVLRVVRVKNQVLSYVRACHGWRTL